MVTLLLFGPRTVYREALAYALSQEPGITVIGQAASVAEVGPLLAGVAVIIADVPAWNRSALASLRALHVAHSSSAILVLGSPPDRLSLARAVEAGAAAVLPHLVGLAETAAAVRQLGAGGTLLAPDVRVGLGHLVSSARREEQTAREALDSMTSREREVLQALALGLTDREIGRHLRISHDTVRTHMVHILAKLGVASRLQALLLAQRHGVVSLDTLEPTSTRVKVPTTSPEAG